MGGNLVEPLRDGDEAYPAIIEAIAQAKRSIALATYIFDVDRAGGRFIAALSAARARGVDVRVLVDDAGARYSRPPGDISEVSARDVKADATVRFRTGPA